MVYVESSAEQLDELLGLSLSAIDIPTAVRARAITRYDEVAHHLDVRSPGSGSIYTQGSIRLGTVVAPITPEGEYDLDLVYRRDVQKASITQAELKEEAGRALQSYVRSRPAGSPTLKEGKRCWTLDFPGEPFHMDILPAIPNADARPTGIHLTDRELVRWQDSNPIAYAEWFRGRMETELVLLREAAVAKGMDIETIPDDDLKTSLQRTVQALKRHRDLHFADHPDDAPASIIITTLAARAYAGGEGLFEILRHITGRMASMVQVVGGAYVVANPVQETENFADRWNGRPERARAFFDWTEQAHADFDRLGRDLGLDDVIAKMATTLGGTAAASAAERFGAERRARRDRGVLGVSAGGLLGVTTSNRAVPRHTFHGDGPSPSRS
jgi:hypothetical protein